jgi:hypothetical protein
MRGTLLAARIFTLALCVIAGAGVGFVLTFTHRQYVVDILGAPIPLGLLGGLLIVAALLVGMRLAFEDRLAPLAGAAGVIGAVAILGIPTASGSSLYLGDAVDYIWILGPTVVAIVVIFWPERKRQVRRP